MSHDNAVGVIFPVWKPAPYWTICFPEGHEASFIVGTETFSVRENVFPGRSGNGGFFFSGKYHFDMMAVFCRFWLMILRTILMICEQF